MTAQRNAAPAGTGVSTFKATIGALMFVEFFSGVIQFYFVPIYPTLAKEFGVSIADISWALIAYTLAGTVAVPIFAKLGDVYGHRRLLRIEVGIVAVGCILIAIAPNLPILVVGRILQGSFPAYLPLMFGLIRHRFSDDRTKRAIAYLSSILIFGVVVVTGIVGLLISATGGITWVLWLPAIGTIIGFGLLWLAREEQFIPDTNARVDWAGVVLLALGLACLTLGLDEGPDWGWTSPRILAGLIVGIVLLIIWVIVENRVDQPLADLEFLFRPLLVPVYIVGFTVYFCTIGGQVLLSSYMSIPKDKFGYGLGLSSADVSYWLLPAFAVMAIFALLTARAGAMLGFRWTMAIGAILTFVGFLGIVFFHDTVGVFVTFSAVTFAGAGFIEGSTRTVVVGSIREGEISMGEGVYELAIVVGGAVGGAAFGAILSANTGNSGVTSLTGYVVAWSVAAFITLIAAGVGTLYAARKLGGRPLSAREASVQ